MREELMSHLYIKGEPSEFRVEKDYRCFSHRTM